MFKLEPAIPQAVSGADGVITFKDVVFAAAPTKGSCLLLASGPGSADSVLPIDYYGDRFITAVTNGVAQVLVNDIPNTQAVYSVGELPSDLTMEVPVKVLDAAGNGVAGQHATVVMTQVPENLPYVPRGVLAASVGFVWVRS